MLNIQEKVKAVSHEVLHFLAEMKLPMYSQNINSFMLAFYVLFTL